MFKTAIALSAIVVEMDIDQVAVMVMWNMIQFSTAQTWS